MKIRTKTQMKFPFKLALLSGIAAASALADQCPHLGGHYHCPALASAPAFDLHVTQMGSVKKTVTYSWQYSNGAQPIGYFASVKGVRNPNGIYGVCRNKGLYLTEHLNDLSETMRNEVTPTGNYVVTTFMGQPYLTCVPLQIRR